jgi:hypothetical protein
MVPHSNVTSDGRTNSMANHLKHVINRMSTAAPHSQEGGNLREAAGSLKERMVAVGSPLLSVLANLHPLMAALMKGMLLMGAAGMMGIETISARQDSPWIRRSLLLVALLTASFTLYHLLSRKHTRRMLLFRGISLLFTAGMIIWSITIFGF